MTYWVIEHVPSGRMMPAPRARRGQTHMTLPFPKQPPRLFTTEGSAKNCLRWWLGGPAVTEYDNDEGFRYAVGASVGKGVEDRIAADMRVVQIRIERGAA